MLTISRFLMYWLLVLSIPITAFADKAVEPTEPESGHFILKFITPEDKTQRDIKVAFENAGDFQTIIKVVNATLFLPYNVTVKFMSGEGPLYRPDTKTIQMPYEDMILISNMYFARYPKAKDEDMFDFVLKSEIWSFYHELAHALIDAYKLPIVGKEEEAADDLAVIIALEYTEDGYKIAMDSAELWDLFSKSDNKEVQESAYWDEHALNPQRFYNIVCLAYGKFPKEVSEGIKSNELLTSFIKEKGPFCAAEYKRTLRAWTQLLTPYFK